MTKALAFILSASLAACAGQAEVRYTGGVTTPELVTMETDPSVMIVANAEEPVFYSENTYYLYRDSRWYRSSSHRGGWSRVDTVPEHIRRIDRPRAYVHVRRDAPRTTYNQREQVEPQPAPDYRAPDRADHRAPDRVDGSDRREPAAQPSAPTPDRPDLNRQPPPAAPPDRAEPTLRGPATAPPGARPNPHGPTPVPTPNPVPGDRPEHQISTDPERAPTAPGQPARPSDQRPAERDDRRGALDPTQDPTRPSYK